MHDRQAFLWWLVGTVFRAYVAIECLQLVDTSFNYVDSRPWAMLQAGGVPARIGALVLAAIAVVVLLDVLLCDVFKVRRLRRLHRLRPLIWGALSIGYGSQAFVALHYGFFPRLALLYGVQSCICLFLAWVQMALRFEQKWQEQVDTGLAPLRDA